ncbi:MAG: CPBP family intramembrane metalloprotease [Lachnospiraceae bacterium]|nr:CPBP family intramembrane metalloprotease [Lachnospiraceae bacterium]
MKLLNSKFCRIISVIVLHIVVCGWSIVYFKHLNESGKLLSTLGASQYLPQITLQSVMVNLPAIILLIVSLLLLKKKAAEFFCFKIEKKIAKILVPVLAVVYAISLVRQLIVYDDQVTQAFRWVYYLVFISFFEEFECRAVMPALLKGRVCKWVEWLLPSLLFAVGHLIMPIVQGKDLAELGMILMSTIGGYTLFGLFFEWCKRASGSLWVGVLLHAIMDFGI